MDPRTIELIHGEIDGANSASDGAELRERLARDPAAFELLADLKRLSGLLERVEPVDPPAGLRQAVVRAIEMRGQAQQEASGPLGWFRGLLSSRPARLAALRYAYVLTAGVVLGVLAAQLLTTGVPTTTGMSGTMAPAAPTGTAEHIEAEGLEGSLRWVAVGSEVSVSLELRSREPVQVVLGFDEEAIGLAGFSQEAGEIASVSAEPGAVTLTGGAGEVQRYTVVLDRKKKVATTMKVEFFRHGTRIDARSVPLSGAS